jgi:hypothetical protein
MYKQAMRRLAVAVLFIGCIWMTGCDSDGGGMDQKKWNETVKFGMTVVEVNTAVGREPDRAFQSWFYWRFGDDEGGVAYGRDGRVAAIRWVNNLY